MIIVAFLLFYARKQPSVKAGPFQRNAQSVEYHIINPVVLLETWINTG